MKIFVSHSSEDREVAERVALAVRASGHDVFWDRDTLVPGESYHVEIRRQIAISDMLVFLLSPASVRSGSYCLSELALARKRWPHPQSRVLPVEVRATDHEAIPNYLLAVHILVPAGNIPADTEAAIADMVVALQADSPSQTAGLHGYGTFLQATIQRETRAKRFHALLASAVTLLGSVVGLSPLVAAGIAGAAAGLLAGGGLFLVALSSVPIRELFRRDDRIGALRFMSQEFQSVSDGRRELTDPQIQALLGRFWSLVDSALGGPIAER